MSSRKILTALAAAAAFAVAGCGDDEKKAESAPAATTSSSAAELAEQAEKSTTPVKANSPEASWAKQLCTGLADEATQLQPPDTKSPDPKAAQKELIRFFTDVTDQLEGQQKVIKAVGAPPEAAQLAGWKKAQSELADTEEKVAKIRQGLRSQDFSTAAAAAKNMEQLGKDFAVLNEYLGPVATLKKDKGLEAAIQNEPACAQVS